MSTPEEVQEPKSKVPPMPPKQADSAATAELHRRFCSDVPNDGTYTLHLNETETIRFFAEADRLIAAHCAAATAKERQARELAEGENARLKAKLHAINLAVDGYVDCAPDCNAVSKLANQVSLIIHPSEYP